MVLPGEKGKEALCQGEDILLAFAQGRDDDLHHVQAIEQIFPEPSGLDRLSQIHAGGGDDAHVGLAGVHLADPFILLLLEDSQQLGLQRQGQVADFIEEEGAALAGGDTAQMISQRAGEGPLDMAEELALQKLRDSEGQETTPKFLADRRLQEWMALASMVLPVPLSPRIRRVASLSATRCAIARVFCITGLRLVRSASGAASLRASWSAATLCSSVRTSVILRIKRSN